VDKRAQRAIEVHQRLNKAYGSPHWRTPLSPLNELISTILSQNTNDLNRDRAFHILKQRFPTWESVRDAALEDVISAIRSAGLANQKGVRIQSLLRAITEERGNLDLDFLRSCQPEQVKDWLMQFKGVGPKTASIVMLFSLNMPAFPVDTHIYRLSGRLNLRDSRTSPDATHNILANFFPQEMYYAAHLNLIRHGREVCHARNPDCERCVLQDLCCYYREIVMDTRVNNLKKNTPRRKR